MLGLRMKNNESKNNIGILMLFLIMFIYVTLSAFLFVSHDRTIGNTSIKNSYKISGKYVWESAGEKRIVQVSGNTWFSTTYLYTTHGYKETGNDYGKIIDNNIYQDGFVVGKIIDNKTISIGYFTLKKK